MRVRLLTKEKSSLEKAKNQCLHENTKHVTKIKRSTKQLEQSKSDLEKKIKYNRTLMEEIAVLKARENELIERNEELETLLCRKKEPAIFSYDQQS